MKRRSFLALLGLAPAAPVIAKELLKQPLPEPEEDYDDYDDYADYGEREWTDELRAPAEPEKDWQPSGFEMALLDGNGKELDFPSYRRAVVMVAPKEAAGVPVRATFPQACEFWGLVPTCVFHEVGVTTLPIPDGHVMPFYSPLAVSSGVTVRSETHLSL